MAFLSKLFQRNKENKFTKKEVEPKEIESEQMEFEEMEPQEMERMKAAPVITKRMSYQVANLQGIGTNGETIYKFCCK